MRMRAYDGFGMNLKVARMRAGKTQKWVAYSVGVSSATICNYEAERTVPDFITGLRIADVLGCDAADLVSVLW